MKYLLILFFTLLLAGCTSNNKTYKVGVSQCSEDIWRHKQNRELAIGNYSNDNIDLQIRSADDDDKLQAKHINDFINEGVDILIVAPNKATTLSEVIDKAYDKGIPVILFDRRTNSEKYTAFMGADNYKVGKTMGELIAKQMQGRGVVAEITGLVGSSPAIERHRGFADALKAYPGIKVVSSALGDWTQQSGVKAMNDILRHTNHVDCVFGHNDRLAMGARQVALAHGMTHIKYYGVDALPAKGGGIELVQKGIMTASYVYPTHGVELMKLALNILEGRPYQRINTLQSAVVDKANADILLLQYREQSRISDEIDHLKTKLDVYFTKVNTQQLIIVVFVLFLVIVIVLIILTYRAYLGKAKLSDELQNRNNELETLYKQLEDMADSRLLTFTNVGHKLRTPLTLISGPAEKLYADENIQGESREMVEMMHRNLAKLTALVNEILDIKYVTEPCQDNETMPLDAEWPKGEETAVPAAQGARPTLLVVDDNAEIRALLRTMLKNSYDIVEAADGQQGLDEARRTVPDLIVSDVMMPVMDGLDMCRKVKADAVTGHIPVLMLTARTLEEQRAQGYAHGADAYLTKPFSTPVLLARIQNLLQQREMLRRIFAQSVSTAQPTTEDTKAQQLADKSGVPLAEVAEVNTFVEKLRSIIQSHLSDSDFNVERIGEEIGMSRVQLYRKTKSLTGMSPVELLRKSRLERASQLLRTTDRSISEIAYETGFSAPSYFAKCYKEEYGMSPGEMRNEH